MEQPRRVRLRRRRARLWPDLALLSVVGLVLVAALGAGGITVYRQFYSPAAFVQGYLDLLASGRAADALRLPGVALDRAALGETGIPADATDALLRQSTLAPLTDISVDEERADGDDMIVTAHYKAGGHQGSTSFRVGQDGWIGVAPAWRFTQSPLSVVELTLRGTEQFTVNGFEIDRRQVAADGADTPPLTPVPLLVFSPGLYSVSVDTAISTAAGVSVLADSPAASVPVDIQTSPTDKFVETVQTRVDDFLNQCATQKVLQPTGCPFGLAVQNRITEAPVWSMVELPTVDVVPDGANWKIPPTTATAHIRVTIMSLYDGTVREVDEDVPFRLDGAIAILPNGSASITVGSPDLPAHP
ncbi:hypothetical protein J2Y69_003494 [Microbacterium resistens]|uniref:Uncharacterized protein n=1 Tax=Microbacterium resistens TaxID=156977 RepID=A0ABU1SIN8_9MICO|nr:hypothetical protein [Microbacterium resistens]MDR6868868.1 hypothetical protein [Microbacterium resistens]